MARVEAGPRVKIQTPASAPTPEEYARRVGVLVAQLRLSGCVFEMRGRIVAYRGPHSILTGKILAAVVECIPMIRRLLEREAWLALKASASRKRGGRRRRYEPSCEERDVRIGRVGYTYAQAGRMMVVK